MIIVHTTVPPNLIPRDTSTYAAVVLFAAGCICGFALAEYVSPDVVLVAESEGTVLGWE